MKKLIALFTLTGLLISCKNDDNATVPEPALDLKIKKQILVDDYHTKSEYFVNQDEIPSFQMDSVLILEILEDHLTNPELVSGQRTVDEFNFTITVETISGDIEVFESDINMYYLGGGSGIPCCNQTKYFDFHAEFQVSSQISDDNTIGNNIIEIKSSHDDLLTITYHSQFSGLTIKKEVRSLKY